MDGRQPLSKLEVSIEASSTPTPMAPPRKLDPSTTITIGPQTLVVEADDLETIEELGRGIYGSVEKMRHKPTGMMLAVKRVHTTVNTIEEKRLLMDLDISMRSADSPFIVTFYGALFRDRDVWICNEVMDTSLEKFYSKIYPSHRLNEPILAKITYAIVSALDYLYSQLHIIHRDVKPSNILLSRSGSVKLSDFGITGVLIETVDVTGCKIYMAPERIIPVGDPSNYDVRSDVWSLGISLIEVSTGVFPYEGCDTVYDKLKQVVVNDAPTLPPEVGFSPEIQDFINKCLKKDYLERPTYPTLLQHPFIVHLVAGNVDWEDLAELVLKALDNK